MPDSADRTHRTAPGGVSFHQRRVHLDLAISIQGRTFSSVESRIVLHHANRRLHGVHGASATTQDNPAGFHRSQTALAMGLLLLGCDVFRAAMNNQANPHRLKAAAAVSISVLAAIGCVTSC